MGETRPVLLIEDDESHALLTTLLLERLGYRVQTCDNGDEAIRLFGDHPDEFDFVITDYTMLPLDGLQVSRRLLEIKPSACIILCTGRDDSAILREASRLGVKKVALKPTNREEMEEVLESAGVIRLD